MWFAYIAMTVEMRMHALFTKRLVESWYSLQIQVANNVLYCKTGLEMKRILSYQESISLRNPKKLITSVESSNVNEVFIFIACRISKSQLCTHSRNNHII